MSNAPPQEKYQVRFDWGLAGFQALAAQADVVIVADALAAVPEAEAVAVPVAEAEAVPVADAEAVPVADAEAVPVADAEADAVAVPKAVPEADAEADADDEHGDSTKLAARRVIAVSLNNRTAVAEWVLARQAEKGARFSIAVIAVGERRPDGTSRFAVEDFLAAGAVIDALSSLGIDHCSPEAAAASAAFVGLRQALRHLVGASETGLALAARGRQSEVRAASRLDDSSEVTAFEDLSFPA